MLRSRIRRAYKHTHTHTWGRTIRLRLVINASNVKVSSARCFWEKLLVSLCHDDASSLFGRDLEVESYANLAQEMWNISPAHWYHSKRGKWKPWGLTSTPMYSSGRDACKSYQKCQLCGIFRWILLRGKILAGSIVGPRSRMVVAKNPPFFILSSVKDHFCFSWEEREKKKIEKRWCGQAAKPMFCNRPLTIRPDGYTHKYKSSEGGWSLWKNPLTSSLIILFWRHHHYMFRFSPLLHIFFLIQGERFAGASYSGMSDNGTAKTGKQLPPGIKPHRSYVCICVCSM